MVDTLRLGRSTERRGGSSPLIGIKEIFVYKILSLISNKIIVEDYSEHDIAKFLFNHIKYDGWFSQRDSKYLSDFVHQIISKGLSFNKGDTEWTKVETETIYPEGFDGEWKSVTTKTLVKKPYRIYDEYDRIMQPNLIKDWLMNYDSSYKPRNKKPNNSEVNIIIPTKNLPAKSGRNNCWKDHR